MWAVVPHRSDRSRREREACGKRVRLWQCKRPPPVGPPSIADHRDGGWLSLGILGRVGSGEMVRVWVGAGGFCAWTDGYVCFSIFFFFLKSQPLICCDAEIISYFLG